MPAAAAQSSSPSPKSRRAKFDALNEHRAEMLTEARELGLSGATDFQAAERFDVDIRTLQHWKVRDPEFAAALQIGKDIADGLVEASLYHKARGYTYRSEKIFQHEGQIIRAETIEHVPPDTTSMIFWLKNRQREKWRDQPVDINLNGKLEVADPRALAMAMLATLRAAVDAPATVIEHQEPEKTDGKTSG